MLDWNGFSRKELGYLLTIEVFSDILPWLPVSFDDLDFLYAGGGLPQIYTTLMV